VQGLQKTADAASPSVGVGAIVVSLIIFLLLYGALAVVDWILMARYARKELPADQPADEIEAPAPAPTY
jgi:cytochrome bd ubiquinol oxidase subunit I